MMSSTIFRLSIALRCMNLLSYGLWLLLHGGPLSHQAWIGAWILANGAALIRPKAGSGLATTLLLGDILCVSLTATLNSAYPDIRTYTLLLPMILASLLLELPWNLLVIAAGLGSLGWSYALLPLTLTLLSAAIIGYAVWTRKANLIRTMSIVQRSLHISEFLSYTLFQVREYLTSITSVSEKLSLASHQDVTELTEKLKRVVAELNGKIKRILESVKTNTTTPHAETVRKFHLEHILQRSLEAAQTVYPSPLTRIRLRCDPEIGLLPGNPDSVFCVLTSLLLNSCEALSQRGLGSHLSVSARRADSHVEVRIVDNGGGIPQSNLSLVFHPLFTTKAESGGLGLGLSMSRRLVERLGGNIEIHSQRGKTLVRLQLPIEPTLPKVRQEEATWPKRRKKL